jgi:glutamine amidotransferase
VSDAGLAAAGAIVVIDYGMGNLRSVWQALVRVAEGRQVVVSADPAVVAAAERVVFPGQGAMPDCMREIEARGLRAAVLEAARNKPFLGICIGQQMLFEHSEEGDVPGLGIIPGSVRRFPGERMVDLAGARLKVPHMGWNHVVRRACAPALGRHCRRRPFLFRAQLFRRSGRSGGRRWNDRLWPALYQCGGAG